MFDKTFKLDDFTRVYNKNEVISDIKEPTESQYNEIYKDLNKVYYRYKKILIVLHVDMVTCKDMAKAIHNGLNVVHNCIDYNRQEVSNEQELSNS